jgi:two-component system, LuxR family, sensor kinase FixL
MGTGHLEEAPAGLPEWSEPIGSRSIFGTVVLLVGFVLVYLALDRISFIGPLHGINITPWSPSTGLAMALLLTKGPRWAPLVFVAELLSEATLPVVPVPVAPVLSGALLVASIYCGAATILRRARLAAGIRSTADAAKLLIATVLAAGLVATGFVIIYAAAGVVPWRGIVESGFEYWIGDVTSIVVFVPALLLLRERMMQRNPHRSTRMPMQFAEFAVQAASIVAALAVVLRENGFGHNPGPFYVLFLPLIWIAVRYGHAGATWAVVAIQLGLITGLEIAGYSDSALPAIQLLMFAVAATGLVLGAVVSERHGLSRALVDSESRRAAILNTARDGVMTIDAHGRIESINPAIERLFACTAGETTGIEVANLIEDLPDLLRRLDVADGLAPFDARYPELDARRADGTSFPIELSAGRFVLDEAVHYTVVIRDITSRREAEARFRQHQTELAHVSRVSLAGEMAAGLAHELSQPLTAITSYARGCLRLLRQPVAEPGLLEEGIAELVQQGERAGEVLDRLRDFVRGGEFRRARIEIETPIQAAVNLIRMDAMEQQVEIQVAVDPGLPAVLADRIQIEQVLLNLLRNAIDAMEGANIKRRSILIKALRRDTQTIEIAVCDTGPGVAAEVRNALFEPFKTTKRLGMGMGLSISRSIVEAHGGSLRMRRNFPSGAIFCFDLPTTQAEVTIDAG